jgi:type VI secretion system protein VasI
MLRCKENKTEAFVNAGMQGKPVFGEFGQDIGVSMRGRYDKGEVFEYSMAKSTDGEAFFFRNAIEEIKYMKNHSRLILEFIPFNSNPTEIRFDLSGLVEAIRPLQEACGW